MNRCLLSFGKRESEKVNLVVLFVFTRRYKGINAGSNRKRNLCSTVLNRKIKNINESSQINSQNESQSVR